MRVARNTAKPYGGTLVDLLAPDGERATLLEESPALVSLQLSAASAAWLRLLVTGALSPLDRFMGRADYESVRASFQLSTGIFFPWPVTLLAGHSAALREGAPIALRDARNHLLAVLTIQEIFEPAHSRSSLAISGPVRAVRIAEPLLFPHLHRTPADVRRMLADMDCAEVMAAESWNARDEKQTQAMLKIAEDLHAALLLNLPAERDRIDDFDAYTRLREWDRNFPLAFPSRAVLNFLQLPHMPRGARGLLLKAIIHKNYGADAFLCNLANAARESRAPESRIPDSRNGIRISEEALAQYCAEIGIRPIDSEVPASPTAAPPQAPLGLCVWFTGLPGAGKSTAAERLAVRIMEHGHRVTLLDGDVVRTHLSRGLSFSREDRDTNVQRIGFVASEIVRHGGIAICAAVSPYRSTREQVRRMMPPGAFVEVFVDTQASVCEQRDVKGFYAKARTGKLKSFTGVDDPYERPEHPEVRIDTCEITPEESEQKVFDFLRGRYFREPGA